MSIQDDTTRLKHMLDAAQKAIAFVNNRTFQDLENDEILALALVKLIEIVGEAASRISKEYQAEHTQIPWSAMTGMRNRLVHAYFDINLRILWQTTQEDLPSLILELNKLPEIKS
ncbi:MAG: hypothetical protein RLZZ381_806 [Cyanobacteriota bacterium]|jgi:uncharacterized protein with HEPN domain